MSERRIAHGPGAAQEAAHEPAAFAGTEAGEADAPEEPPGGIPYLSVAVVAGLAVLFLLVYYGSFRRRGSSN